MNTKSIREKNAKRRWLARHANIIVADQKISDEEFVSAVRSGNADAALKRLQLLRVAYGDQSDNEVTVEKPAVRAFWAIHLLQEYRKLSNPTQHELIRLKLKRPRPKSGTVCAG